MTLNIQELTSDQQQAINSGATHYIRMADIPEDMDSDALVDKLLKIGFDNFEIHPEYSIWSMWNC